MDHSYWVAKCTLVGSDTCIRTRSVEIINAIAVMNPRVTLVANDWWFHIREIIHGDSIVTIIHMTKLSLSLTSFFL